MTDNVSIQPNLQNDLSIRTKNLGGPGPISMESAIAVNDQIQTLNQLRNDIIDYIRLRLGDQMIDVELDKEHYDLAIKQALAKYRQRAANSVEESYCFLDLLPEVQEYILPNYIQEVRCVYRRGIGSVTGTTASQFEPFASGYLNTYMLVAGRVGGLTNYEFFVSYQKLAMRMFGGFMNFTWNRVTKKLTLVRKIPQYGHTYFTLGGISASGTSAGAVITINLNQPVTMAVGDSVYIQNCPVDGYNAQYILQSINNTGTILTVLANQSLAATSVSGFGLSQTQVWSPNVDGLENTESVLLQVYNYKPDSVIISDTQVYPWIQEYALALCKSMLGQARSKFATVNSPQGGTQLNGTALIQEAATEIEKLENELKTYVDGSVPLSFVIG
ncbi:MAG: hypothetical protein RLZZ196_212 [Bacteroidota bacterium]|jgi:hypothetical protein